MNEYIITTIILLLYFSPVFYQLIIVVREQKENKSISLKRLKRFLKFSFLAVLLSITFIGIISHTNYLDYEKPLTYDRYEEITFKNFRGLEFYKKTLYGSKRFAYVFTEIDSEIEDHTVMVRSLFHPSRSFVYKKNNNSTELLTHEKYHIKITELFARKAKKRIANLKTFNKSKIEEILNTTTEEAWRYQKQYDYDTFHSYVLGEQKKYEKEIDSFLILLETFKHPKISFDE